MTAAAAVDKAIMDCAAYVSQHATGTQRYGWGWVMEAARVAKVLAEVRVLIDQVDPDRELHYDGDPR